MIRDITIGQYFPGKSAIHKMDPRIKILLSILYIVMLFVADNMWGLLLGVLFGFAAYLISRIPVSMIWKSMKPVVPIVIFTAVLNLFLSTGDPLWQWKFLKITKEGIETAVFMSVRILCLIAGTSLLTYTTSPIALTDGIERLLSPLKKIKLPVEKASNPALAEYIGKEVVCGLRPECIHDSAPQVSAYADSAVEAHVDVTELMGAEIYLYLVIGETQLTARVSSRSTVRAGQDITIAFDMSRIHIFDKDTEKCILH